MKICCICKLEKELSCFCKNKLAKDCLSSQCKDCAKEYRIKNKDKTYNSTSIEYRRNYIDANRDHINELRKKSYCKEKSASQNKANYLKHRDKRLLAMHIYYSKTKEQKQIYNTEYRRKNIQSILLRNRARIIKLTKYKIIPQNEIDNLLLTHNNRCFYCKTMILKGINLHLDHKIPLSRNGPHTIDNLVPACAACNLQKGAKTDTEFLIWRNICSLN